MALSLKAVLGLHMFTNLLSQAEVKLRAMCCFFILLSH